MRANVIVARVIEQLADALDWPRSRPARLLAGERAARASSLVLCADEAALAVLDAASDAIAVLATPPASGDGRLGRRSYDPFAGSPNDVASWRRTERVVLDASLLLAGGRGGVDEHLVTLMGMTTSEPARTITCDVRKLVGYVPVDALEQVRSAVFEAGAGTIGSYDQCSWSTHGTGTFRGGEGTSPAIGTRGNFEQVEEVRFETIVAAHLLDRVVRAYRAAHPYEEPAFDVLAMALPARVGFGRRGVLGDGGGSAAWSALAALDPGLVAHGAADSVPVRAHAIVYSGAVGDVLDAVLDTPDLALVVAASATSTEIDLLVDRSVSVLIVDRARAFHACAAQLAQQLSQQLELAVSVQGALAFPTQQLTASGDYASGTWRLHFDGGSRGNPGPAAYGWVLYDPSGSEHEADGVTLGSTTNNVAEWTGLLRGLEHAADRGIRSLDVRGDSELVVKQVTGAYKVKNEQLKPLAAQVAEVLRRFDSIDVQHVYRTDNARADELANEALDGLR